MMRNIDVYKFVWSMMIKRRENENKQIGFATFIYFLFFYDIRMYKHIKIKDMCLLYMQRATSDE
jgi:hypothetical protein